MTRQRDDYTDADMWRDFKRQAKANAAKAADRDDATVRELERARRVQVARHSPYHWRLSVGDAVVDYYPTRGTIVRDGARLPVVGVRAALRLLGVHV